MSQKDYWNHEQPAADVQFAQYVSNPELARLLPILYRGRPEVPPPSPTWPPTTPRGHRTGPT